MLKDREILFTGFKSNIIQYLIVIVIVSLTALVCRPLSTQQGYHIVSLILLFVVSLMAIFLGIGPILLASTLSSLVWNFFFIPPHFALHIEKTEDKLMFGSFFFIALVNGVLTNRIRRQEILALEREERTNVIFELTRELSNASGIKEVLDVAFKDVKKHFLATSVCFLEEKNNILRNVHSYDEKLEMEDYDVAQWVFKNGEKAGRFTGRFSKRALTFYPLTGKRFSPGVIVVRFEKALPGDKEIFWNGYLTQISNAIEREILSELALKARLLDESDKLYKTLFTLISHEFRIPIATIMGASDTLLMSQTNEEDRTALFNEIFKASARLNHLIENLLNMSRLESGKISVRLDWCDINDLVNKVTRMLTQEMEPFRLVTEIAPEMPLVRIDFGLMEQVIYNLILNSSQHSPAGTTITVKVGYLDGCLKIVVADNGPGFPPGQIDKVFDKFFRIDNSKAGGLGLGLSIVKGLVEAHKGTVTVENGKTGGAFFVISIPSPVPDMEIIKFD